MNNEIDNKQEVQGETIEKSQESNNPVIKAVVQVVLVVAGLLVIWMLGSPQMKYDPETRIQIITLLGSLASAAGAASAIHTLNRR